MPDKFSVYALIVMDGDPAANTPRKLLIGRKARMVGAKVVGFIPGMPEPLGGNRADKKTRIVRPALDTLVDEINEESGRQLALVVDAALNATLAAAPLYTNTIFNSAQGRNETYDFFVVNRTQVTGPTGNNPLSGNAMATYQEREMDATVEIDLSLFRAGMTPGQLIDELMRQSGSTPTAQELANYMTTETAAALLALLQAEATANGP